MKIPSKSTYVYIVTIIYMCAFFTSIYVSNMYVYHNNAKEDIFLIGNILQNGSQNLTFMDIFLNNEMYLIKTYLGVITCGGYALILTIYNASFFGFFVGAAFYERGLNYILLHTIPHSFELIPLILSAADSVYIGIYLFLNIVGKCKIRIDYKEYIIKFIGYSIILFLAAICEVYVSIGK